VALDARLGYVGLGISHFSRPQVGETQMALVRITVSGIVFEARFEAAAPLTTAAFRSIMPFRRQLIQARWSGEAAWIPLGDMHIGVDLENATSYPSRGDILFHPAGTSEAEILFAYGSCRFASKVGELAGNHFLTITRGLELLPALGHKVLWEGAQPVEFVELAV
jgi:hypothetical protein